jgi:DNA polymerase-4
MDGDAFFVACEVSKNPSLRGKPAVTGEERGIATAISYEAKALGVSRGMPIFQLKKNFPSVIILPGDYATYALYSQKMFDVVRRYTDTVEEYSIDECFADLTGWQKPLRMTYREILENIKKEIKEELDITVSIGLAPTKTLAKVASKWCKPDGLTIISKENSHEFLLKVPIYNVWGIGPSTSQFLMRHDIKTAHDLANKDKAWIEHFLSKPYFDIWQELNCLSVRAIDPEAKNSYASIQKTKTFHPPTKNIPFLLSELSKNVEAACLKARHYHLAAKRVHFFLKTQEFRYHAIEIPFLSPVNLPEIILPQIEKVFNKVYRSDRIYRTTGVTLRELISQRVTQPDLFGNSIKTDSLEMIHEQIDSLEEKFGRHVVHLASTQKSLNRKVKGTDSNDLDRDLLFL